MYSVFYFYQSRKGGYLLKTDYPSIEEAEMFIQSDWLQIDTVEFICLLKDGNELIKGTPLETSEHINIDELIDV